MNQVTKLLLRKYIVLTPLKFSFRCCCKLKCKDVLFYPSTKRLLGFIQEERKNKGKDNVLGFLNYDCCSIRSQGNLKCALFFAQTNQLIDQYSRSKKTDQNWSDTGKRYCDYSNLGVTLYDNIGCLLRMRMNIRLYIPRVSIDGYQKSNTHKNSHTRTKLAQTR